MTPINSCYYAEIYLYNVTMDIFLYTEESPSAEISLHILSFAKISHQYIRILVAAYISHMRILQDN